MKASQIFKYIWRINAVIILLVSLLASVSLAASALYLLLQATRTREVSNVVNVSNDNSVKAKTSIGLFDKVLGTEIIKAPLYTIQEYDYQAGAKESSSIQNYIFYDPTQKTSSWLRSKNYGLLLSMIALPENNNNVEEKQTSTIAYIYLVVDKDTNNDQRINEKDQKQIAISDASGSRFKILIEGVDSYNGSSAIKNNRISLLYLSGKKLKAAEIDLRSQEIISNTELLNQP